MTGHCLWDGTDFSIYDPSTVNWRTRSGIYIFAFVNWNDLWEALYVGQADNFRARLSWHERWEEALHRGATHVHARVVPQAANRDLIEARLIFAYQPPMNTQLR